MILRNLFKYGLMAIFILQNAIGTESDRVLVIGCRPWDNNMQGFSGLKTAHFVDRMIMGAPTAIPSNFYHLDIDDEGMYSSGKFSDFANDNIGKYKTIIVDWATYQHIHQDIAWTNFAKLLDANGNLIVPVARISFVENSISFKTAQALVDERKLTNLFNPVNILSYDKISQDTCFDLLRRPNLEPGRLESCINMEPAIILATKQSKNAEDTKNIGVNIDTNTLTVSNSISGSINLEKVELPPVVNLSDGKSKEIKFPNLAQMKKGLIEGRSTLFSEEGDAFSVQSIGGSFHGFRSKAIEKGFDIKLKYVGNYVDHKGINYLSGVLDIIPEDRKIPIQLFLRSLAGQRNKHMIYGGMQTQSSKYYGVLDQIKIYVERDLYKSSTSKGTRMNSVGDHPTRTSQPKSEVFQASTTVIAIKNTPEIEHRYQERYNRERYEESFARCLRVFAKRYEEQIGKKGSVPVSSIRPTAYIEEHGKYVKLLHDNVERNRGVMDWIDAEFRWCKETESLDFWALQAIRDTYIKVDYYAQVATNPKRNIMYAEEDDIACKNANQYMLEEIEEWIDQELMQKLVKKGFAWQ
ncbi:MAG: hypothetical protein KF798_06705 [Candidatus Paracaedibacteraceae bacterium]|nr:hypothetical protein [Candidatus Paracaedibacteraceae bacterium]